MFNRLNQVIIGSLLISILGLSVWAWNQSRKISNLKAENQVQAQTIKAQTKTISQMKEEAERNRQLTEKVMREDAQVRSKADEVIRYIPAKVKASDAFNAPAPDNVIEFLRQ